MKLILKILALPFAFALTMTSALCLFALSVSGIFLNMASCIISVLAVVMLFTCQTTGGIVALIAAFLISPFGLPAVAEWLIGKLKDVGGMLTAFIYS